MPTRKTVLYIAISLDGYIARENGDIEWLDQATGEGDNGYATFYKTVDTIIMGKTTYDQVMTMVEDFPYPEKKCYVYSTKETQSNPHVEFVQEDVVSFTNRLLAEEGNRIWIVGGANLVDAFMQNNLVDEYEIAIMPILLGSGIPLFGKGFPEQNLELVDITRMNQIVMLHYRKK